LKREYNLTPKQVQTLLQARDNATGIINGVQGRLNALDGNTANVTITTTHREVFVREGLGQHVNGGTILKASGGYISGPGGPRDDLIPARLSNGEYVIQAAAVQRYGRDLFERLNSLAFASGGYVGAQLPSSSVSNSTVYGPTYSSAVRIERVVSNDPMAVVRTIERRARDAQNLARLP
jgi:hypothetical protein